MTTGITNSLFFRDSESPTTGNLNIDNQGANNFRNIMEEVATISWILHLTVRLMECSIK